MAEEHGADSEVEDANAEEPGVLAAPAGDTGGASSSTISVDDIAKIAADRAQALDKEQKQMLADRKAAAEAKKQLTRDIRNTKKRNARLKARARNLQDRDLMDLIAMNALVATAAQAKAKAKGKAKAKATA